MDCLLGIQKMLEQGIQADLIVTDPPYFIKSTKAGGKSELARSIQPMNDQLAQNRLTVGIDDVYLKAMWDVTQDCQADSKRCTATFDTSLVPSDRARQRTAGRKFAVRVRTACPKILPRLRQK